MLHYVFRRIKLFEKMKLFVGRVGSQGVNYFPKLKKTQTALLEVTAESGGAGEHLNVPTAE